MNDIGFLGVTPLGKLYRCHYTNHVCIEKYIKLVASMLPQCPVAEAMFFSDELPTLKQKAIENRKKSTQAFNEMDANCNTCKHFDRLNADNKKGSNSASNFVYGNCNNPNAELNKIPYQREGYQVMVYVADWMGMACWKSR